MAEIKALKGWRYNNNLNIDTLTSPLFDIQDKTDKLYLNPINSIHISQPKNTYEETKEKLEIWKKENIIIQDSKPSIYVYYQEFSLLNEKTNENNKILRKGFICNVKLSDWNENIVLRHENTIPSGIKNRLELLEGIELNTSPTHGIYDDHNMTLEKYMDESIKDPIYDSIDYQGVRDIMSIIDDPEIIKYFIETLKDKKIIIADGHHRYESSLLYMKKMKSIDSNYNENNLYNYHLMYLSNSDDKGLKIFPTHRIINNIDNFNENQFISNLSTFFDIKKLNNNFNINQEIEKYDYSFGLILKNSSYLIILKDDYIGQIEWNLADEVKELDVTVLHYFILYKVLGISEEEQRVSNKINFKIDFSDSYKNILNDDFQGAIITKAVTIQEIEQVCYSGHIMPQKSTYFYPKMICGFVFSEV